jgi:hypothetical protein
MMESLDAQVVHTWLTFDKLHKFNEKPNAQGWYDINFFREQTGRYVRIEKRPNSEDLNVIYLCASMATMGVHLLEMQVAAHAQGMAATMAIRATTFGAAGSVLSLGLNIPSGVCTTLPSRRT